MTKRASTVAVVCHHTGGPRKQTVSQIRGYHKRPKKDGGRGYLDIGYHLVSVMGALFSGRPLDAVGSHCYSASIDAGRNRDTIGIAVTGNLLEDGIPEEDARNMAGGIARVEALYGPLEILDHGEAMTALGDPDHTDCPGMQLGALMRHLVHGKPLPTDFDLEKAPWLVDDDEEAEAALLEETSPWASDDTEPTDTEDTAT